MSEAVELSGERSPSSGSVPHLVGISPPPGVQAIYNACRRIYSDQPNPLQVTALVKYWFGGPDPLDYISMYVNNGNKKKNIPVHWHYVTFGLSDLHGDGRVHERSLGVDGPSGFGFELTFRLRREPGETAPPTWPASLLQALARYVFQSGNTLCPGDHIPWRTPLDNSESRIQHILMSSDPQLSGIHTPFGNVNFVQVVGVCEEELRAAQQWNGSGVLSLMQMIPVLVHVQEHKSAIVSHNSGISTRLPGCEITNRAGGSFLVTDMRRGETIFEIDPQLQLEVEVGIETDGSNLSGVSGQCVWQETSSTLLAESLSYNEEKVDKENSGKIDKKKHRNVAEDKDTHLSPLESEQIKSTLTKGLSKSQYVPSMKAVCKDDSYLEGPLSQSRRQPSLVRKSSLDSTVNTEASDVSRVRTFEQIHVTLNLETGSMLPLALRGRLKHGRHFTFKSTQNETAVTLVPSNVVGSIATLQTPYASHGPWLQVLLTDDFIEEMLQDVIDLTEIEVLTAPRDYVWTERGLSITVLPDSP